MVGRTLNTLVILLDGAADEPFPVFGGKTPLEYLDKKFIDSIASNGDLGWTEGKDYTHLFLLEFLAGRSVNCPSRAGRSCWNGGPDREGPGRL